MAKTKQKKDERKVKPMVTPKFNSLIFTNYKPIPRFRSSCINCD